MISPAILALVLSIAAQSGVPDTVAYGLMIEESGGYARAQSRPVDGYRSKGLFQLYEKPSNLNELIYKYWYRGWNDALPVTFDIYDPVQNATVALRYLATLHVQFGSWKRALWFYNAGTARHPPHETKDYALRIINRGDLK